MGEVLFTTPTGQFDSTSPLIMPHCAKKELEKPYELVTTSTA